MDKSELNAAVKRGGTLELTDAERAKKQGSFIPLPSGITHYELKGGGEAVVLVHGYATPYYIYDKLFDIFVSKGYKVLRYDLLGRGYSERVEKDYTPQLFAEQLDELTSAVLGGEKFMLVGTSMGGGICACYFKEHPEKVKKLVLLAPAGMDTFKPPIYMKLCRHKGVGTLLFNKVAGAMLLKKCSSELYNVGDDEKDYYQKNFADAYMYKNFLKCTLSSLRNTILNTQETMKGYGAVGASGIPVLCVWGTADKTMPYYQHTRLLEVCKQTKLITYENSGHIFVFDEGKRTAEDILEFFNA